MRHDLLALSADDLVTLSNRGIVKRAQQEMDSGQFTYEIREDEMGGVEVRWSDGVECRLPAGKTLREGECSCPSTTLCRHLVRSVLVYQEEAASKEAASKAAASRETASQETSSQETSSQDEHPEQAAESSRHAPWDPGAITDEELARHFSKAALNRARKQFEEGHVIELVRSSKPAARIHTLSVNLRFLAPGDVRYSHCDCAEPAPCSHVPLIVWAFRLLESTLSGGLVSTHPQDLAAPTPLLDEVEQSLRDLAAFGLAGAPGPLVDRLRRLEGQFRQENLVWPAEIMAEIVQQWECYSTHDARFSPTRVADLIGELCIRSDAIRSNTGAVPQLFIRGSSSDRITEVGSARLVGLGCGVHIRRGSVELAAYLQDMDSGTVVALSRDFADPPRDSGQAGKDFWQLAGTAAVSGVHFGGLGRGQLLIRGGKRTPGSQFMPGRAKASFNPQSFQWESLRPPLLAEDSAELSARLGALPPAALRPRRVAENLYVCPVAGVDGVQFSSADQTVVALLRDKEGSPVVLAHPYTARGREGTEALLSALRTRPEALRFVAGQVRTAGGGVVLSPISLVFQENGARSMIQPWVDRCESAAGEFSSGGGAAISTRDPAAYYPRQAADLLGELCLVGLERAGDQAARDWKELLHRGMALGFVRFLEPIKDLVHSLDQKSHSLRWDPRPASNALLHIASLAYLAQEELPL